MRNLGRKLLVIVFLIIAVLLLLSFRNPPDKITYGTSFSTHHSNELKLNWKEVYDAVLNDLEVKHLRLSAHWHLVEPKNNQFSFQDLDYQMNQAREAGADVILAVGRRLPGWPECHEAEWFKDLPEDKKHDEIFGFIETVVNRYKNYPNILYWQVENEPFLTTFARHHCGDFLDENLLKEEIALVKKLDPDTPILVTDSGELGLWYKAYRNGDAFGTSLYLYIWNHQIGPMKYPIPPAFFRIKQNAISFVYEEKPVILIELSAEPWLLEPIIEADFKTMHDRMTLDKFNKVINFAKKTDFEKQYLWGAEWWYWMKQKGYPEYWERAKEIFKESNATSTGPTINI